MTHLPDTVPVPLSAADGAGPWTLAVAAVDAAGRARCAAAPREVSTGAVFDVCRGALALRALLAVNGAVRDGRLAGADSGTRRLAALGPAIAVALVGHA